MQIENDEKLEESSRECYFGDGGTTFSKIFELLPQEVL